MNNKTLWVFIDDSKSNNKKYFLTMFIVTEYSNFDTDIKNLKSRLKNIKRSKAINEFLNLSKYNTYIKLSLKEKHIVNNELSNIKEKIIEHSFLSKKIEKHINQDFYYKDHIKQIANFIIEKYKYKYKQIVFDHASTNKIDDLIAYENKNIEIRPGNDLVDSGLIVVDLLRCKINF